MQSATSGNLLDNDNDGDPEVAQDLDVTAVSGPGTLIDNATTLTRSDTDGSLVIDKETGAYTYTVNNGSSAVQALGIGESITKTFTYTMTDDGVPPKTDTADLTITITGTNDGPVANADVASVTEDGTTSVSGNAIGALSTGTNPAGAGDVADTDVDGDTLTVVGGERLARQREQRGGRPLRLADPAGGRRLHLCAEQRSRSGASAGGTARC